MGSKTLAANKLRPLADESNAVSDRQLVDRCLRNDAAAWDELYAKYHDRLVGLIRLMIRPRDGDLSIVDEIAARVWYAVCANKGRLLDRFDVSRGCRLSTFLAAIARSEAASLLRSEKRRRRREKLASRSEAIIGNADRTLELLLELQDSLTPRERQFVESCLVFESEPSELELSDANRWQLRHRVRRKLERAFRG